MKRLLLLLGWGLLALPGLAQDTEFQASDNGLIYPDTTVRQLKFIVDSLHLKFKVCDLNRPFHSLYQGKAHYCNLSFGDFKQAMKDMDRGISFEDLLRKHKPATVGRELLVLRHEYQNGDKKHVVQFESFDFSDEDGYTISFDSNIRAYTKELQGKWLYRYHPKSEYSAAHLQAFYFPEPLRSDYLPQRYGRMVQYADCLVDTSAGTPEIRDEDFYSSEKSGSEKTADFMNYIAETTGRPVEQGDNDTTFYDRLQTWDSLRLSRTDSLKLKDPGFMPRLQAAAEEALLQGGSGDHFEEYVARYYSARKALNLKRSRRVMGSCSQDSRPRIHALNIARLSATAVYWEVFLRAHLDIMNDNFPRATDGSYAWGRRKTYIRELEVLDINVQDLLLGISLRVDQAADNHYYGSISRVGRALAETKDPEAIEAAMSQMISDKQLDYYNRVLIYYLYRNYNYNLEDKTRKSTNTNKFPVLRASFPKFIATKLPL